MVTPTGAPENGAGRITRIVDDAGEETRGYGRLGELVRSTRTVKPLQPNGSPQTFETRFEFDSFGRMKSMLYPDLERLSYHYDAGGLVAGATGNRRRRSTTRRRSRPISHRSPTTSSGSARP